MTLRREAPRAKRRWGLLGVTIVASSLLLVPTALATAPSTGATFEASDGNLTADSNPDWNSFSPLTWTGTVPYQTADKTISSGALSGWHVQGLTDAQRARRTPASPAASSRTTTAPPSRVARHRTRTI